MRKNLIFTDREVSFLKELNCRKVEYMIVGLSAAGLQGAPVVTQDVDLWFKDLEDPGIEKALEKVGGIFIHSIGLNPPMFAGDAVKFFDIVLNMHGLGSFEQEVKGAEIFKLGNVPVRVLPLSRIIRSKTALGREKDKIVMKVLKDALKLVRSLPVPRGRKRK